LAFTSIDPNTGLKVVCMALEDFGTQEVTDEDRTYRGSRYREVRDAIFANPYQKVWGGKEAPELPHALVTIASVYRGILPYGRPFLFRRAAERAVDSHADLRWGPDGRGFRRIVHPNGVGLTGIWEITEPTPYSGYFKEGSRGLAIGRYSTCCSQTLRGETRSLSLVGKLYPTTDPDHPEPYETASFITQQDIGGDRTKYINDAELRNAPNITPWRRAGAFPILALAGIVFSLVDPNGTMRQLYQIAELGKPADEPTRAPKYMRLLVAANQPRIEGEAIDLRDEVLAQIFDPGDPAPRRKLVFEIEVTDDGSVLDVGGYVRWKFENWRKIGRLSFDDGVASYNVDHVLHFNHPGWRKDQNDPTSARRPALDPE
jgi:hypothetical protein